MNYRVTLGNKTIACFELQSDAEFFVNTAIEFNHFSPFRGKVVRIIARNGQTVLDMAS